MIPAAREQGYVFVETLIAAAIVAAMVAVMFQSVQAVTSRAHALDDRRLAMLIAQSQLAAAGVALTGSAAGVDGAFAWRVEAAPDAGAETGLERITVRVDKAGKPLASLSSLRLARQ